MDLLIDRFASSCMDLLFLLILPDWSELVRIRLLVAENDSLLDGRRVEIGMNGSVIEADLIGKGHEGGERMSGKGGGSDQISVDLRFLRFWVLVDETGGEVERIRERRLEPV